MNCNVKRPDYSYTYAFDTNGELLKYVQGNIPSNWIAQNSYIKSVQFAKNDNLDIGLAAFYDCGLEGDLIIPDNISSIGAFAFNESSSINHVFINISADNLAFGGGNVFTNGPTGRLYVTQEHVGSYGNIRDYYDGMEIELWSEYPKPIPTITPILPPRYLVISPDSIDEGATINIVFNTENIGDATYSWVIEGIDPNPTEDVDFTQSSRAGNFTTVGNTANFNVTATAADDQPNGGEEYFKVVIKNTNGDVVASSKRIKLIDKTSIYTFRSLPDFINEGDTISAVVDTSNVADATTAYWTINHMGTQVGDFEFSSGTFPVNGNSGTFNVKAQIDAVSDGGESFSIQVREGSYNGIIKDESTTLTINNVQSQAEYYFGALPTSVNEGSQIQVDVNTANFGTDTLYWYITGVGGNPAGQEDFAEVTGSFDVVADIGSFFIDVVNDEVEDDSETFSINLCTGSVNEINKVKTSNDINIVNIIGAENYYFDNLPLSVDEGNSISINVGTNNVPNGRELFWTIDNVTSQDEDFVDVTGSFLIGANGSGTFDVETILEPTNFDGETDEDFRIQIRIDSTLGQVQETSNAITIIEKSPVANFVNLPTQIDEGVQTQIDVQTENIADLTNLWWKISGDTITANDFPTILGAVQINNDAGNFNINSPSDSEVEGDQIFNIILSTNLTFTNIIATSSDITLIDKTPSYSIICSDSVFDGNALDVQINTNNVSDGTARYWQVTGVGANPALAANFVDVTGSFVVNNDSSSFNIQTVEDLNEIEETFNFSLYDNDQFNGTPLVTSQTITIDESVFQETTLFRVNCGGSTIAATDGKIDWEGGNDASYVTDIGLTRTYAGNVNYAGNSSTHPHPFYVPTDIFKPDRYTNGVNETQTWVFDVSNNDYLVNLLFMENFSTANVVNYRLFHIDVNDVRVATNFDRYTIGGGIGMASCTGIPVSVTNQQIKIDLIGRGIENSAINGIEIIQTSNDGVTQQTPVYNFSLEPPSNVDEGNSFNVNIATQNVADQTPLYWKAIHETTDDADFNPETGSFLIDAQGAGSFTVQTSSNSDSNDEIFSINVYDNISFQDPPVLSSSSITINATVFDPITLYRINCGGPEVFASDGKINWDLDASSLPSPYNNSATAGNNTYSIGNTILESAINPPPEYVPEQIFKSDRYDNSSSTPMIWTFENLDNADYDVNLYFAETYNGITSAGQRLFDVYINNVLVLDDYDRFGEAGGLYISTYQSIPITVTNGTIEIEFNHVDGADNPVINGIEIIQKTLGDGNSNLSWTKIGPSNINGSAAGDEFGGSLSMSKDGTIVAIGAQFNDDNGTNSGKVRIYQNQSSQWVQLGGDGDIVGGLDNDECGSAVALANPIAGNPTVVVGYRDDDTPVFDAGSAKVFEYTGGSWSQMGSIINGSAVAKGYFGSSAAISADGTIIAIGAPGNTIETDISGYVKVFAWSGSSWVQQGADISGEAVDDEFGYSVSLSSDGSVLAVGARYNDGNGIDSGSVRVYDWNVGTTSWDLRGEINGESAGDEFGTSISLSSDGNTLAVGAPYSDDNGSDAGSVVVYEWTTSWVKRGNTIKGNQINGNFGWSVSISDDGNTVAIGAINNDDNGVDSGSVEVYEWATSDWVQNGDSITGDNAGDKFGNSVSISADGSVFAASSTFANGEIGYVAIFEFV